MDYRQLATIREKLESINMQSRKMALGKLSLLGMGDKEAYALANKMLGDKNANVRSAALKAAILINSSESARLLDTVLADHHQVARKNAVLLVVELHAVELCSKLAEMAVNDLSKSVKRSCFDALIQLDIELVENVLTKLFDIEHIKKIIPEEYPWYLAKDNPLRVQMDTMDVGFEIVEGTGYPLLLQIIERFLNDCLNVEFNDDRIKRFLYNIVKPAIAVLAAHDSQAARKIAGVFLTVHGDYKDVFTEIPGLNLKPDLQQMDVAEVNLRRLKAKQLIELDEHNREKAMRIADRLRNYRFKGQVNNKYAAIVALYYEHVGKYKLAAQLLPLLPYPKNYWDENDNTIIRVLAKLNPDRALLEIKHYLAVCRSWQTQFCLARQIEKMGNPEYIPLLIPMALGKSRKLQKQYPNQALPEYGRGLECQQAVRSITTLARKDGGKAYITRMLDTNDWREYKLGTDILKELKDK